MPTFADILAAADRIAPFIHRTPVLTCSSLDAMAGRSLFFKCENFQKVGAFKARGACNAVFSLSDEEAASGVVTHSSGNHAQALAMAAARRGIAAHIVMPTTAPAIKRDAVLGYGATVIDCAPTLAARETTAAEVLQETGGTFIHPYNNEDVIAGQGTAVVELLDEVGPLDGVMTPVGGGGLLSGTAVAIDGLGVATRLFAGEPAGADDAARSMAAGELIPQTSPETIADGLLTSLGTLTWPIIRDHVEAIIIVDDDAIAAAMRLIWQRMKIVIEPSAAVAVAAVLSDEFRAIQRIDRVGIILTGGNYAWNE
jgi:threonine dehydratase